MYLKIERDNHCCFWKQWEIYKFPKSLIQNKKEEEEGQNYINLI